MYVILMYDIHGDEKGAAVQRRIFKACKRFLSHVQLSVFEGEITQAQLFALKAELMENIRTDSDSLIIFKSRQERWLDKEILGKPDESNSIIL